LRLVVSQLAPDPVDQEPSPFYLIHCALRRYGVGRRIGLTANGRVGIFPGDTRSGDIIVFLDGVSYPYILRKTEDPSQRQDRFVVVGEACESLILTL
jgi:hypothetical protein